MQPYFGIVDRWILRDADLELRLSYNFYPVDSGRLPIAYVRVNDLAEPVIVQRRLAEIHATEIGLSFSDPVAPGELELFLDEEDESLVLRAARIAVSYGPYELEDYVKFTARFSGSTDSLDEEVRALNRRIAEIIGLMDEQTRRVALKAEGHLKGSTARTLYEQQLSFIDRVRRLLDR